MAYVQSYSAYQIVTDPTGLVIADTSTGTDAAIASRRVTILKSDGTTLVPSGTSTSYVNFPLSDGSTKTISVLDKDYAVAITVDWVNSGGSVLYTTTTIYGFYYYANSFYQTLLQAQVSNPNLLANKNWLDGISALWTYIDGAANAISLMGDITNAQLMLGKAYWLYNNLNLFY